MICFKTVLDKKKMSVSKCMNSSLKTVCKGHWERGKEQNLEQVQTHKQDCSTLDTCTKEQKKTANLAAKGLLLYLENVWEWFGLTWNWKDLKLLDFQLKRADKSSPTTVGLHLANILPATVNSLEKFTWCTTGSDCAENWHRLLDFRVLPDKIF